MDRESKRRYFVVGSVFMEVVTPLFRQRLETEYTSKGLPSLQAFINSQPVIHILFHLRRRNTFCCTDQANCTNNPALPLNYHQWNLLYWENPAPGRHNCHCKYTAKPLPVDDLDITLSSLILLNCCNLQPVEDHAIRSLRQYKNDYLSHNTKGKITLTEYRTLWNDLKSFVLQLDPSKDDDLIRLERRPLDDSLCTMYNTSLLDLHKKLDEMDTSISRIDTSIQTGFARMERLLTCQDKDVQGRPYRLGQNIFRLHRKINLKRVLNDDMIGCILGGVMMDDGRLVFCVWSPSRLLICNTDGSEADCIQLQSRPYDVTAVNNSTVAVILPEKGLISYQSESYCIEMYDINNKDKLKSIPVPISGLFWSITTINNKLVVDGFHDMRLLMIDHQTGEVVKTIQTDCSTWTVHAAGDRIFYGSNGNTTLYCYRYTDDKVTTTSLLSKLYNWYSYTEDKQTTSTLPSSPFRITSLQDGSLYVVCNDGSVQHVSSDGQHYKPVTTKELARLKNYTVVNYNSNQRQLMTYSNETNIVQVFNEM